MSWSLSPSPSEMYSIIRGMCGSVCLNTTMLSLTGFKPTRNASRIPRKTGASSPLRMSRNDCGSSESIERFTAREFHGPNAELPCDPEEPLDLVRGHLVLVGHPRPQDRTEAFVVAVDAAEIAPLRHADPDVGDLASERVDEHVRPGNPRCR